MKKIYLTISLLFLFSGIISAHPHITTVIYPHIYFDKEGMNGFYLQWIYDPMYSSQIIYDIDVDMNLELDDDEQVVAKSNFFSILKNDSWFMTIMVDGVKTSIPTPVNFSAEIDKEDETIMYTFYIPLQLPYKKGGTNVNIEFTDPTSYTAFKIPVNTLKPNGTEADMDEIDINYAGIVSYSFAN